MDRTGEHTRSNEISRRRFLGLGAAGAGALALPGCSLYSDLGSGGGGATEISFVHWRGEDEAVLNEIIQQFQEEYPEISVRMDVFPSDQYNSQIQADLVSGSGGVDVFASFPGSEQFNALREAGIYADLSDVPWRDRFQPGFIEAGAYQGSQLAYPYQLVFNIPVYNRGLMDARGLDPENVNSWDGFLEMCETIKQDQISPILFAGDISPGQFINPMLMNNQPSDDVWEKIGNGEASVTDDWFVKTLDQTRELQSLGYYQDDVLGSSKEGVTAQFAQEDGASLALGSYMMATVAQQNPEIEQGLLAPITVPAGQKKYDGIHTTTFMLGVSQDSKHPEEAKQFIEFLTRPEIASKYANQTGQMLTLKDVNYNTKELQAQVPWQDKNTLFQVRYEIEQPPIAAGLETSVTDVLSSMSPEEAASKFQATIDRAIQG